MEERRIDVLAPRNKQHSVGLALRQYLTDMHHAKGYMLTALFTRHKRHDDRPGTAG